MIRIFLIAAVVFSLPVSPARAQCPTGFSEVYDRQGNPECVSTGALRSRQLMADQADRSRAAQQRQVLDSFYRAMPEQEELIRQRKQMDKLQREQRQRLAPQPGR